MANSPLISGWTASSLTSSLAAVTPKDTTLGTRAAVSAGTAASATPSTTSTSLTGLNSSNILDKIMTQIYGSNYASLLSTAAKTGTTTQAAAVDPVQDALATLLSAKAGAIQTPTNITRQIQQLQASPVTGMGATDSEKLAYNNKLAVLKDQLAQANTTASYSALSPVFTNGWTNSTDILTNTPANQQALVAAAKVGDNKGVGSSYTGYTTNGW